MKRHARLAIATTVAVALVAAGCSSNEGGDSAGNDRDEASTDIIGTAEDSKGPAPEVEGAKEGGTIDFIGNADFAHLDPARTYVSSAMVTGNQLLYRTLNGYREDGEGDQKLVGDLATDPGKDVNSDCTVWEFTLKDGLKYADGSAITAEHVAYGIARSMAVDDSGDMMYPEGPQFIQNWLDPKREYEGPYEQDLDDLPGTTVDGNKITFEFDQPRCETPFAVAMPTTAPIPEDKDTKKDIDNEPVSSGPYQIEERTEGESTKMVRNEHWDPDTDPIRNAFPDEFTFKWGNDQSDTINRIAAAAEGDGNLMTFDNVPAQDLSNIMDDKDEYGDRLINEPQKYTSYLSINTETIDDLKVRQALNHAFPRERWVQVFGGESAMQPSTTLMGPTAPGYAEYDVYETDVEKAKELLDGEEIDLKFPYRDSGAWPEASAMLQEEYAKVGINLERVSIPDDDYYGQIAGDHDFDLYWNSWGQDWPSGSSIFRPLFHSSSIAAETNYAKLDEADLDKRIEELESSDEGYEAIAPQWGELGEQIMEDYAPVVPTDYLMGTWIGGEDIGGMYMNKNVHAIDPSKLYVKE